MTLPVFKEVDIEPAHAVCPECGCKNYVARIEGKVGLILSPMRPCEHAISVNVASRPMRVRFAKHLDDE